MAPAGGSGFPLPSQARGRAVCRVAERPRAREASRRGDPGRPGRQRGPGGARRPERRAKQRGPGPGSPEARCGSRSAP